MKEDGESLRAWRTDPEVIRDWQRRGLEAMRAKTKKAPTVIHEGPIPRAKKGGSWKKRRAKVIEEAHGMCQAHASRDCQFAAEHVHHVLPRALGGKYNGSTPLLAVCHVCHDWIHDHPRASYARGWLMDPK